VNLHTYKILYVGRHQDLLREADEARLPNLAQENQTKTNRNFPKIIDDVLQQVGQKIVSIYHQLYQTHERLIDLL
jgi:hypothetical protein